MSYIYKDKHGKYRYVYEVTAYRDGKKTRNRKIPIGRIDGSSGLVVYKEEYLDRLRAAGEPLPDDMLIPRHRKALRGGRSRERVLMPHGRMAASICCSRSANLQESCQS